MSWAKPVKNRDFSLVSTAFKLRVCCLGKTQTISMQYSCTTQSMIMISLHASLHRMHLHLFVHSSRGLTTTPRFRSHFQLHDKSIIENARMFMISSISQDGVLAEVSLNYVLIFMISRAPSHLFDLLRAKRSSQKLLGT